MRSIILAGVFSLTVSPIFAARPVAAWDVVPYQRVSGTFTAGVVAFHDKAIRVDFTINGRKFRTVEAPSYNERTGVEEYFFSFPAARLSEKFGDKEWILGAKVYVDGEKPLELAPLTVFANGRGTLGSKKIIWVDSENGNEFASGGETTPVKTLARAVKMAGDGGTVYLKPGVYTLKMLGGGFERRYWTVITHAPGVKRSDIRLMAGRPGTEKLHFKNLDFYCNLDLEEYGSIVMGEGGKSTAWFENCNFTNLKGRYSGESYPFGNTLLAYVTGGATYEMTTGPNALILRGHTVKSVVKNPIPGSGALVVNCSVEDVKPAENTSLADVITANALYPDWSGDSIIYGLKSSGIACRVLSLRRVRDAAFVDVSFDDVTAGGVYSSISDETVNVLFVNFSLPGQELKFAHSKAGRGDFKPTDVIMKKCNFGVVSGCEVYDGSKGFDLRDSKVNSIVK